MLAFVENQMSDRKLRLFGLACCRRHVDWWEDHWDDQPEKAEQLFLLVEQYAEGELTQEAFQHGVWEFGIGTDLVDDIYADEDRSRWDYLYLARIALTRTSGDSPLYVGLRDVAYDMACAAAHTEDPESEMFAAAGEAEEHVQAELLREIIPNPCETFAVELAWLNDTVLNIANSIYQRKDFTEMPILADALEEAGCADSRILDHLREKREHLRGCWALDLILRKE